MSTIKRLTRNFVNNGIAYGTSIIERRRIRLINIFNAAGMFVILIFFVINLLVGSIVHGFFILSGLLIVTFPVIILNAKKRTDWSKYYLIVLALIFYNFIAYKSILDGNNRNNGFFLIGFSTMIIALFDNPAKTVIYVLTVLSAIILKYVRFMQFDEGNNTDHIMSMVNLLIGFTCVYFFTDIFKSDLIKSEKRARKFALRLRRQKSLVQSERDELVYNKTLLRRTIDNLPVFISMMDATGKFIIVNSRFERALKMKIEEIEGKHYNEVLGSRISDLGDPLFQKCLQGVETEIDHPIYFPSGEIIHAFGKYIPLVNNRDKVTHVLSFTTDIRKLKKTEKKLREINSAKDKILSILSHDLRSPLNSLSGLLEYSKDIDRSVFDKLLENIKHQVGAINFTLDNVLNWVRTQLGGFVAHPQSVDLSATVKGNIDLYQERMREKSIKLKSKLSGDEKVWVDADHLDIVIRNLLSNAIKFTPEGGKIELGAARENGNIKFHIQDSGIGMDKEMVEKIMQGINKEHPHTSLGTKGEKGTGLGLNFCQDILALNNADMEIKSQPGNGSTITLNLPIQ